MQLGFVGAGLMGHGMAKSLLAAGHDLTVLAHRNRAPVDDLVQRGATEARSLQCLARQAVDVVFLCLPNSDVVQSVVEQLVPDLRAGAIIVDSTTSHPLRTRQLHGQLAERSIDLVDAPITGGPKHAENAQLTALVGADDAVFTVIEPLLHTFASTVLHMGGPAAGHTAKLLNNAITNTTSALLAEVYSVAREHGVDWRKLHQAMMGGAANSGTLAKMVAPALDGDFGGHAFALANAEKDARYYCTFRESNGEASLIMRAVQATLAGYCARGLGDKHFSELLDVNTLKAL
ncbi:MAG: 3-hydroxyisobutyrate dehydrogenase-like beta-hydroxyacid dehydrogenase [Gammaproteobacteria bacterium]|jgi:3-hydroxyisobutyrate dehydrogenase-like beta-hydroxyacid dehydrogenase